MRLHKFGDLTKYFPSKIETEGTAARVERNPSHNIEDDVVRQPMTNPQSKRNEAFEDMMK